MTISISKNARCQTTKSPLSLALAVRGAILLWQRGNDSNEAKVFTVVVDQTMDEILEEI